MRVCTPCPPPPCSSCATCRSASWSPPKQQTRTQQQHSQQATRRLWEEVMHTQVTVVWGGLGLAAWSCRNASSVAVPSYASIPHGAQTVRSTGFEGQGCPPARELAACEVNPPVHTSTPLIAHKTLQAHRAGAVTHSRYTPTSRSAPLLVCAEHATTASGASKLRNLMKGHQADQDTAPPLTSRYIRVVNTFDVSGVPCALCQYLRWAPWGEALGEGPRWG